MPVRLCECGCGQETDQTFVPGHDSEALRMLLHLEGVLDHDEPIADFLHRRGYGRNGRTLRRAYQDRLFDDAPPPPIDGSPRIRPGQLTDIAHRVGKNVLKRPVTVGSEHRNSLRYVLAPGEPGVYVLSEGDRPGLRRPDQQPPQARLVLHRSTRPRLSNLAAKMARIKTGRMQSKTYRSGASSVYLYDEDVGALQA